MEVNLPHMLAKLVEETITRLLNNPQLSVGLSIYMLILTAVVTTVVMALVFAAYAANLSSRYVELREEYLALELRYYELRAHCLKARLPISLESLD